ncbi:TPA: acyltransferase family protein [Raoultella ornithinolytica]
MFRLDINGLRFIAVSMVVLFHFKFGFFYGGYAGVDVFFVISGFLMQEICSKGINTKWWFLDFYKKRFTRIYPALLFSVIFTAFLILYSETPSAVTDAFKQALSSLLFVSNIYYQLNTGDYFSTTAEFNWFLHTWSLSVEWQYYLLFPLALWISTFTGKYKSVFYAVIIIVSLSICLLIGPSHTKANFYLLPTRAWELMAGALISTITAKNKFPRVTELTSIAALIAFTVLSKESNVWPGVATIIPVTATALLLHANIGNQNTLLRNKFIQKIGSASYSIYLFHWPIVSFMANNAIEFTLFNSIVGVFISVCLGFFSYSYLERLFVKKNKALLTTTIVVFSALLVINKVEPSRLWIPEEIIMLDKYKTYAFRPEAKIQFGYDTGNCFLTSVNENKEPFSKKCLSLSREKKNILLIGDSHAAELSGSIRDIFSQYNILQATASGCMPFANAVGEKRCTDLMHFIYTDFLQKNKVDYIFISAFWSISKDKDPVEQLIKTIKNINHPEIYVIGQTKSFSAPFYRIAQKTKEDEIETLVQVKSREMNKKLSESLRINEIKYLNIFDLNCSGGRCVYFDDKKIPMLFDDNHFTREWADINTRFILKQSNL